MNYNNHQRSQRALLRRAVFGQELRFLGLVVSGVCVIAIAIIGVFFFKLWKPTSMTFHQTQISQMDLRNGGMEAITRRASVEVQSRIANSHIIEDVEDAGRAQLVQVSRNIVSAAPASSAQDSTIALMERVIVK